MLPIQSGHYFFTTHVTALQSYSAVMVCTRISGARAYFRHVERNGSVSDHEEHCLATSASIGATTLAKMELIRQASLEHQKRVNDATHQSHKWLQAFIAGVDGSPPAEPIPFSKVPT